MGKSSGSTPDVKGAAETEGEYSRETARDVTYADRADQFNPYGSIQWGTSQVIDPATGEPVTKWTQNQSLNPALQGAFDNSMGMMNDRSNTASGMTGRINNEMGSGPDWDQFGDVKGFDGGKPFDGGGGFDVGAPFDGGGGKFKVGGAFDGGGDFDRGGGFLRGGDFDPDPNARRQAAEDSAYSKATSRLDPRFEAASNALDIKLRNQGLSPGDQSYDATMANFGNERTDAYNQAGWDSVAQGRDESNLAYGQALNTNQNNFGQRLQENETNFNQGLQEHNTNFNQNLQENDTNFNQRLTRNQNNFNQNLQQDNTNFDRRLQGQDINFNQGLQEQQSNFNQALQGNERANALRNQQIQEYIDKRGFSLAEANALTEGQTPKDLANMVTGG